MTPDEYVEAVLSLVESIPPGRVMSYGAIADALAERSGRTSARLVGTIMARYGGGVPWHRVVASNGRLPPSHEREAGRRLAAEGVALRNGRVPMPAHAWHPETAPRDPRRPETHGAPRPTAPRDPRRPETHGAPRL